ncbi:MAG: hypothetical protein AAB920_01800 [Patescibacteria group bacterium]
MDKNSLFHFLKKIEWRLVGKIAFVTLMLLWALGSDFAVIPVILFVLAPTIAYFSESPERRHFRASYFIMCIVALLGTMMTGGSEGVSFSSLLIIAIFAVGIAIEIGLFHFYFRSRMLVYGVFHIALMVALFSVFFVAQLSLLSVLFILISLILLFREFFALANVQWRGRALLMSVALGFFGTEIALLVRFMPLGFVNASAFLGLTMLLVRDAGRAHFEGALNLPFILRSLAVFFILSVVIFSVSVWGI